MRFALSQLIYLFFAGWIWVAFQGNASAQTFTAVLTNEVVEPFGVAVDQNNFHYLTDSAQNRILRFLPETGEKVNFAGLPGSVNAGSDEGKGAKARFFSPQGIIFVSASQPMFRPDPLRQGTLALGDMLVVADSGNHRIRIINLALDPATGEPVRETHLLAGSSVGFQDGAALGEAKFNSPSGLALDTLGNLWVTDTLNHSVRYITPQGQVVTASSDFFLPSGITLDPGNRLYIADSGTHSIKRLNGVGDTSPLLYAGSGSRFLSGFRDDLVATQARFNFPRGLLWVGGDTGLLVSDSRNGSLRSVFFNDEFGEFSVETFPNSSAAGALNNPVGLGRDAEGNLLMVDLGANTLFRISTVTVVLPQVANPVIGTVRVTENALGQRVTQLVPVINSTFDNDVVVAIVGESGTETYYTLGETGSEVPAPGPNGSSFSPPTYRDGVFEGFPPNIIAPIRPDLTLKSISVQDGRLPSEEVSARIRFQTANPEIVGDDPSSFILRTATTNATIWYTLDGSSPSQGQENSRRYEPGQTLNVVQGDDEDVLFRARAFKDGYSPSSEVSKLFEFNNIQFSTIGFNQNFDGSPGSTLALPVSVNISTNQVLRSLQFRVEMEPVGPDTPPAPIEFRPLTRSTNDFIQAPVPSETGTNFFSYVNYRPEENPVASGLAVAFIGTNSALRVSRNPEVVVLLAAPVPASAKVGDTYRLRVLEPSGTLDGEQTPAPIRSAEDRLITVRSIPYMVGDTAVADWYNAGSFGSGDLNNNDVNNVMKASLGIQTPFVFSDLFDAMDSFPEDQPGIAGGDGQIRFLDVQLTLLRSLGLRKDRYYRYRMTGGTRTAVTNPDLSLPNVLGEFSFSSEESSSESYLANARLWLEPIPESSNWGSLDFNVIVETFGETSLSGLQFKANISAGNSVTPEIADPIQFHPAPGIPSPVVVDGTALNEVACLWNLSAFNPSIQGRKILGQIRASLPDGAPNDLSYQAAVFQFDGSGNAALEPVGSWSPLQMETRTTLIERQGESGWVWEQELPAPEWAMHYFGTSFETDHRAQADADPDEDGMENWREYLAGTSPVNAESALKILSIEMNGSWQTTVTWKSVQGRNYYIERRGSSSGSGWNRVEDGIRGNGEVIQWMDPNPNRENLSAFYRLGVSE